MNAHKDPRLAEIERKWMMVGIYNLPGIFCVAGGLLGKFGEPDEIPFRFLTNPAITTALLIVGGASLLWLSVVIISLAKEQIRIRDGRKD